MPCPFYCYFHLLSCTLQPLIGIPSLVVPDTLSSLKRIPRPDSTHFAPPRPDGHPRTDNTSFNSSENPSSRRRTLPPVAHFVGILMSLMELPVTLTVLLWPLVELYAVLYIQPEIIISDSPPVPFVANGNIQAERVF